MSFSIFCALLQSVCVKLVPNSLGEDQTPSDSLATLWSLYLYYSLDGQIQFD